MTANIDLEKLAERYPNSRELAQVIRSWEGVYQEVMACHKQARDLEERTRKAEAKIKQSLVEARKKCEHWLTQHYTGPNNGDDYTECLCCGAEVARRSSQLPGYDG